MMLTADDIKNLLGAARSPRAAWRSVLLVARHAVDVLRHGRGTRLLMGNALCARLLSSLDAVGVPIWTETALTGLTVEAGRVTGATVQRAGTSLVLSARVGVVLATGGFAHSQRLQQIMLPQPLTPMTAMPEEVGGDGMEIAVTQGAALGEAEGNGAFWAPVSVHRRGDGRSVVYPHFFLDRGKPGVIAVDREGKRFVNEATSYDQFVRAMFAAGPAALPCFLIADTRAARAYGLGLMLPGFGRRRRLLADCYLHRADSIEALAGLLGIDPARLRASVDRFNCQAEAGIDPDFRRGETAANQVLGDPTQKPNPCLGKLAMPPFYAVELHPGLNGTSTGLHTDEHARVLRADGSAIAGLYACGNDMGSMMEGTYPGPGITIGPAMVFAYSAVADMLAHDSKT
jgi:succinate dehydrogenase/fumarate reductase flavoprotein subunit